jgi:O-antigen ligase
MNDLSPGVVICANPEARPLGSSHGTSVLLLLTLTTLFAGIILGYPFWHTRSLGIPLTLDRILLGGAILGAIIVFLHKGFNVNSIARSDIFLVTFLAYLGTSATMTVIREHHLNPVARYFFFYFVPAVLYFCVRMTPITYRVEKAVLIAFGCLGIYLSLTGLAEVAGLRSFVVPAFIMDRSVSSEFFGRARGPLLNPVVNGFLMTAAWAAWFILGRSTPRRWWLVVFIIHGIMAAGVISTLTRSVWLGAGLSGILLGYCFLPKAYRPAWLATGIFGIAVMILAVKGFFWEMKRDRDLTAAEAARSAQLRPVLAQLAWQMAKDHPFFGVGLAEYDRVKMKYLANPQASYPLNQAKSYTQHNVFFSILVETGGIGLMVFLFLLEAWGRELAVGLWAGKRGLFVLATVTLMAYLVNGLFHDVSIIPQMNAVLFTVVGLAKSAGCSGHDLLMRPNQSPYFG